ncbi:hypothetical protein [Streptomyces sp. NPDC048650]|uniref:hypothetical protein n=1 Tax=unclassified Streptomyces TaxID=2593676 RepID=UPI0037138D0B
MRPVACGACGNQVLCEKFSPAHTQVQWTGDAAESCPRIRARVAAGEPSATVRSCEALRAAIARAVEEGALPQDGTRPDGGTSPGFGLPAGDGTRDTPVVPHG